MPPPDNFKQEISYGETQHQHSPQAYALKLVPSAVIAGTATILVTINIVARMKQYTSTRISALLRRRHNRVRTCVWQVATNSSNSATGHSLLTKTKNLSTQPAGPSHKTTLLVNMNTALNLNRWRWRVSAHTAVQVNRMVPGSTDSAGGRGLRVNDVEVMPKECSVASHWMRTVVSES